MPMRYRPGVYLLMSLSLVAATALGVGLAWLAVNSLKARSATPAADAQTTTAEPALVGSLSRDNLLQVTLPSSDTGVPDSAPEAAASTIVPEHMLPAAQLPITTTLSPTMQPASTTPAATAPATEADQRDRTGIGRTKRR